MWRMMRKSKLFSVSICLQLLLFSLFSIGSVAKAADQSSDGFVIEADRVVGSGMSASIIRQETSTSDAKPMMMRIQYKKATIYGMKLTKQIESDKGPVSITLKASGPVTVTGMTVDVTAISFQGACIQANTPVPEVGMEKIVMVAHYMNAEESIIEKLALSTVGGRAGTAKPSTLKIIEQLSQLPANQLQSEIEKISQGHLPLTCDQVPGGDQSGGTSSLTKPISNAAGLLVDPLTGLPGIFNPLNPVVTAVDPFLHPLNPLTGVLNPIVQPIVPVTGVLSSIIHPLLPVTGALGSILKPLTPVTGPLATVLNPLYPVTNALGPVLKPLNPMLQTLEPITKPVESVTTPFAPILQKTAPIIEKVNPVIEQAAPVVEKAALVIQQAAPVVQQTTQVTQQAAQQTTQATQQTTQATQQAGAAVQQKNTPAVQPVQTVCDQVSAANGVLTKELALNVIDAAIQAKVPVTEVCKSNQTLSTSLKTWQDGLLKSLGLINLLGVPLVTDPVDQLNKMRTQIASQKDGTIVYDPKK